MVFLIGLRRIQPVRFVSSNKREAGVAMTSILQSGLLTDSEIIDRIHKPKGDRLRLEISGFFPGQRNNLEGGKRAGERCVSYGLTSFGYDIRLGMKFRELKDCIGKPLSDSIISPFADQSKVWSEVVTREEGENYLIPPGGCVLAESYETVQVPEDVGVLVLCKSTWARCFLNLNTTPLEPGWCLSEDTEILTSSGWKLLSEVSIGEMVLTRRADGVAEYQPVVAKQSRQFQGQLLWFRGRSVDQMVTPEHELFVHKSWNYRSNGGLVSKSKPLKLRADSVFGKHNFSFDRQVSWRGEDLQTLMVAGREWEAGDFCEFYGSWLGDGSAYYGSDGGYHIKLAVVTKDRKRACFANILDRMGVKYSQSEHGFQFYDKQLCLWLMRHGKAKEKFIDRAFLNLSPRLLRRLKDGLMNSDGCLLTGAYKTTSRKLANDVQELAFKVGESAIVRELSDVAFGDTINSFSVRFCDKSLTPKMPPRNHSLVDYSGMVYDVTVPNHVFFCRRGGKASWTGNCGTITLELHNQSARYLEVFSGHGIGQLWFFAGNRFPLTPYNARLNPTYQNQNEPTPSRLSGSEKQ